MQPFYSSRFLNLYLKYPLEYLQEAIELILSQKKDRILMIPLAIPIIMKIPIKEPVIRRTVPSTLPFLRKKLTMLAERIPKPRMGRAESRINPTFPKDITFFKIGLLSKWARK
jgi:hypothetical protein